MAEASYRSGHRTRNWGLFVIDGDDMLILGILTTEIFFVLTAFWWRDYRAVTYHLTTSSRDYNSNELRILWLFSSISFVGNFEVPK